MRILRDGEKRNSEQTVDCKIYNCQIYVRKDFTVSGASEWYYGFVGEYSYMPFTSLICSEDAQILEKSIDNLSEPVEVYTTLNSKKDNGVRNVYLRLQNCDRTEDGNRLYLITITDILDIEKRTLQLEANIAKYRHFMTLSNEYYFEYTMDNDKLVVYKYVNEKSIRILDKNLKSFAGEYNMKDYSESDSAKLSTFCDYLKEGCNSFELDLSLRLQGTLMHYSVKGGVHYKNKNMVAGIMVPCGDEDAAAYYLTPAARDAGTGLLNKKAATEYAVEKMHGAPDKVMWLLIMDIDDFKNINDSFGHLFGDQVIKKVADTLKVNIGHRGIVGRFGGDEFFALVDGVETRDALKTMLKTIVKELMTAFDPQCKITTSIGISQYPKDGDNFETLFGKADKALYIAKEKGKNRHIIYDEAIHGAYSKDSVKTQTVAFVVSREKRRQSLIKLVNGMHADGARYVTENPEVQKNLRNLFDLDGLTIYTDYGNRVLCRDGNYVCEPSNRAELFKDENYEKCFEKEDILVVSVLNRAMAISDKVYRDAAHQEIGACIRCIARIDEKPFVMIDFDVFNCSRKWSDNDIEMLGLVGCCLGKMICDESAAAEEKDASGM
jgi:diguanylate cyclase (GGDEF)-like protein